MSARGKIERLFVCLGTAAALVVTSFAQRVEAQVTQPPVKVVVIKGLVGVKDNTKGTLMVGDGLMHFAHEAQMTDVAGKSIEDVLTGEDSQRVVRGTAGTLSWFAPYGAGRFLALFRTKLDTVTIKYRDADGGLHGAIFTMAVGEAELVKKELLTQGARTTFMGADAKSEEAAPGAKEKQ